MSDPRIGALIAMGKGRLQGAKPAHWVKMLQAMPPVGARAFFQDTSQGPIALAGRGAGKSTAMACKFDSIADTHPNASSVFVAFSAERARDILLPAIWMLNDRYQRRIVERRGDKSVVWPNGYRLLFRGCGERGECDKRRGTPWAMAGWDEAASLGPGLLDYDIHECVEPRLVDYKGQWFVGGTPGAVEVGYWHKLSSGKTSSKVHEWDARTNPYLDAISFMYQTLQRMSGVPPRDKWPEGVTSLMDIINEPKHWHLLPARFVREYLGKWVKDLTAMIYRLGKRNNYTTQPLTPTRTTIGCDLGSYNEDDEKLEKLDKAALTVAQSHATLPTIWIPTSRTLREVDLDILHVELRKLLDRFPDAVVHVDSASAGKLVELTFRKWGIPIVAAVKGPKKRRIQLVQSQVDNGNLQLHETECTDLRTESVTLTWNEARDNHNELCQDDCWDSALMAIVPHLATPQDDDEKPAPPVGSPEWEQQQELDEFEQALEDAHNEAAARVWG
jgi:hypothetical protein